MNDEDRIIRFKDADWFELFQKKTVVIGGAGGIGSWLSLFLARANPYNIVIYDRDVVDISNLGGQFFANSQAGKYKVESVKEAILGFTNLTNHKIMCNHEYKLGDFYRFNPSRIGAVFAGFDNMKSRSDLFEDWRECTEPSDEEYPPIFIDGRMLAEGYQIFAIPSHDKNAIDLYRDRFLKDDNEIADLPCTLRATSHAAASLAANMMGIYTNHLSNVVMGGNIREVPFFYDFDIGLMNQSMKFVKDFVEHEDKSEEYIYENIA